MLTIGIKYCGGCNPTYDRVGLANKVIADYSDKILFQSVPEDIECIGVILFCGCRNCCVSHFRIKSISRKLFIKDRNDFPLICSYLDSIINRSNEVD